jgi:hypothetical protein
MKYSPAMAKIVLGLAASHSPMLSVPAYEWVTSYGAKDQHDPGLPQYPELYRQNSARLAAAITLEKCQERFAAVQGAMDRLAQTLQRVSPDAVIVIGDDHHEMFSADHMPAVNVYWGDKYLNSPVELENIPPFRRSSIWAYHPQEPQWYPCDAKLGLQIIESLIAQQFDVAHSRSVASEQGIGHAFNFIVRRFMAKTRPIPLVPIFLNTYFPPTQPTVKRCYAMGRALREAIESWDADKTIAVVASGGLSHVVIDEEFDRSLLGAMSRKDIEDVCGWPETKFQSGTSEIKTWIVLTGAMEQTSLHMRLIDYVPCYRSLAGTGVGAGFAEWV